MTFINDYCAFVEMVDVVSIFQTDEQRLEWRVYEQSKKKDSKAIFILFYFLENKYFYIKTKKNTFLIILLVFNTTIKSMPEDKQNLRWIIIKHT